MKPRSKFWIVRKVGTVDQFLLWGPIDWGSLESNALCDYSAPPDISALRLEFGQSLDHWTHSAEVVEYTTAKRELEEHRLRALASRLPTKTDPAPAPMAVKATCSWEIGAHVVLVHTAHDGSKQAFLDGNALSNWELDEMINSLVKARAEV